MGSLLLLETVVKDHQRKVREILKQRHLEQVLKQPDTNSVKRRFKERFLMKGGDLLISLGLKMKRCC